MQIKLVLANEMIWSGIVASAAGILPILLFYFLQKGVFFS